MNDLALQKNIPSMSDEQISLVRDMESLSLCMPQVAIETSHAIHGGMYTRSIMIPAGTMITGALVKVATMLIIQGDVVVYIGDDSIALSGHNVLPAGKNRKQAFVAITDVYLTMVFCSNAKSIREAEDEFTDESGNLISRQYDALNQIIVTGE